MAKLLLFLLFLSTSFSVTAQNSPEEAAVKKTIETFFEGFHAQDTLKMRSVMGENPIMQSIGQVKPEGDVELTSSEFSDFLKSMATIPKGMKFEEKIHSYEIKVDGNMANAWTPYSLLINDQLSHCGVNNFQLFKKDGEWKIIYLVDTRRREGCEI